MSDTTRAVLLRDRVKPAGGRVNQWLGFLVRRLAKSLFAMWVIVTLTFFVLRLSSADPVRAALGATADEALVRARREQLGLDLPLFVQYANYLLGLVRGDLGVSLVNGRAVSELVATRLPATLELSLIAFALVLLIAVPLGLGAAVFASKRSRGTEGPVFSSTTGFLANIPEYLLGVGLVIVFSIVLRALPVAGNQSAEGYVLPAVALATASAAALARLARVEAIDVLREDYIRTARSKRLPRLRVYLRHALPNMLTATLTFGGVVLSIMITSGVLVEQVFNWPGIGQAFVNAIGARDYGIVQGLALVYAAIILIVHLLVDVAIAALDPRTTLTQAT